MLCFFCVLNKSIEISIGCLLNFSLFTLCNYIQGSAYMENNRVSEFVTANNADKRTKIANMIQNTM